MSNFDYTTDLKNGKIDRGNFDANIQFLEETGLLKKDLRILEIGCGAGRLTNYLIRKGFDAIGFDISETLINEGHSRYPDTIIFIASGEADMPLKDSFFDIVLSFDVLEHIPDVGAHLSEVRRVLKSGGFYLFQTPNKLTNVPFEIKQNGICAIYNKCRHLLHDYWQPRKRFEKNNCCIKFYEIFIGDGFFDEGIKRQFGGLALVALRVFSPGNFPCCLRAHFFGWSKCRIT